MTPLPVQTDPLAQMDSHLSAALQPGVSVPDVSLVEFLGQHARVRLRDGSYAQFSFVGRRPLEWVADLISKIVRNCVHQEAVEIDGQVYQPGALKGATVVIGGGAQFGKTVLELNVVGWATTTQLLNAGYYTSDQDLLATIVDTKFRPDVVDQVPWMRDMIQLNKSEGKSGRTVDRKNAFQVSTGAKRAFGYFNGMQRPPTTISLDIAILDEVDDIPEKNIGFISGRLTNSDVQLTVFIGTQRVHAAGQNARYDAGTQHRCLVTCARCGLELSMEEHWPAVCRVAVDGFKQLTDPKLDETLQFDPDAVYYAACPECGAELDRDAVRIAAQHPERARQLNWSLRVSQMEISAIPWRDLVASWFAALADPNPEAMVAWHCDRRAIPHAGATQPITPQVLARARKCGIAETAEAETGDNSTAGAKPVTMSLTPQSFPRFAGMDTGPRSWLWINEARGPLVSPLVWAEMVPSGAAFERLVSLAALRAFECVFIDAGGEPDLTKRIVLALNGLQEYAPPIVPRTELRKLTLASIGAGVTWDGNRGLWSGLRAAAVEFSLRDAGGIQHDIGVTQDGKIYPLIKCNRSESIQGLVNDFLTPSDGVLQQVVLEGTAVLRTLPRQRLPQVCLGAGVTDTLLDTHLLNLRRVKPANGGKEDWADGVENHLGLAATYARLAQLAAAIRAGVRSGVGHSSRDTDGGPRPNNGGREPSVPNRSRRMLA